MTDLDELKKSLNISDAKFDSQLLRELEITKAKLLGWLHRVELPTELHPILLEAAALYFQNNFPDYLDEDLTVAMKRAKDQPEVASIADGRQSISFRSYAESISAEARSTGLDSVLGRFYDVLHPWRQVRLRYYLDKDEKRP